MKYSEKQVRCSCCVFTPGLCNEKRFSKTYETNSQRGARREFFGGALGAKAALKLAGDFPDSRCRGIGRRIGSLHGTADRFAAGHRDGLCPGAAPGSQARKHAREAAFKGHADAGDRSPAGNARGAQPRLCNSRKRRPEPRETEHSESYDARPPPAAICRSITSSAPWPRLRAQGRLA